MPVRSRLFFSRLFLLATVLGLCNHSVVAFHSRHVAIIPSTKLAPPVPSRVIQPFQRSISIQSHIVDDDIFLINSLYENPESAVVTTTRGLPWFSSWLASMRTDRKQMAELGISFMLSYNLISNINGSMFLSLSWYISSVRVSGNKYCRSLRRCLLSSHAHHAEKTGLSPLAPGGWKPLLAAYAGLYVFNTLVRPLRFAVAVGFTKKVSTFLERTQDRLGCSKAFSVGFVFAALIAMWLGLAAAGITLASTLAGVPIWKGI